MRPDAHARQQHRQKRREAQRANDVAIESQAEWVGFPNRDAGCDDAAAGAERGNRRGNVGKQNRIVARGSAHSHSIVPGGLLVTS